MNRVWLTSQVREADRKRHSPPSLS